MEREDRVKIPGKASSSLRKLTDRPTKYVW